MARMCMSSNSQTGKMRNQTVFRFLLLYNVFETVYRIVQAADGRTHGKDRSFFPYMYLTMMQGNSFARFSYLKVVSLLCYKKGLCMKMKLLCTKLSVVICYRINFEPLTKLWLHQMKY